MISKSATLNKSEVNMKLKKIEDYETETHKIIILVDPNNPRGYAEGQLIPKKDALKKSATNVTT